MPDLSDLFVLAFLGHLIGDYLTQSTWMAITKSEKSLMGWVACTVHVSIYTISVCIMLETYNPIIWTFIFVPHWIIDHWSLGEVWSSFIGGRTTEKTVAVEPGVHREFAFAFYAPVYIAVDNTWHLLCLYATIQYLMV